MQIYLVGGAVRDSLLQYPIKDKDYLVTGATIQQMLDLGYQQVGRSFPVFLHPETHQEYALARTEKKSGSGYTGFVCDFSTDITVEQDLLRRDLTINAMAMTEDSSTSKKTIIDPYNGQQDLNDRILRHVSDAFSEDPLRVLRVARFAARYHHLGFTIAEETLALMAKISASDELLALTPERVWQEIESALAEQSADVFFEILRKVGALAVLLPELDALWGVPNPPKWHPEIDTGLHTMMALKQACLLTDSVEIRFAVLCHDFGKGLSPVDNLPHHHGHEKSGVALVKQVCQRFKIPNSFRELAEIMSEFHSHVHRAFELKPSTILKLFDKTDVWRKPERFNQFLLACKADLQGRTGFENKAYPQSQFIIELLDTANKVAVKDIIQDGFTGPEIRTELSRRRIEQIQKCVKLKRAEPN
ncbi:multifunctional CCA addition/repair protein [uncultured Psychrosphaera sp.]|uniref:multifunctional CCA addition/repair protein n=1 Tax=uncultured Psychrosphaera sp. TaxID=1403522 RepID=UPI002610E4D9|nr:multifunctional CCA addition/repair protein [uncultured Psychrosphaera sp.]